MTWIIDRKDDQKYVGDGAKPVTVEQYASLITGNTVEIDGKTISIDDGPFYVPTDDLTERGGPGSGHRGHEGRPGEVGGSLPSGVGIGREINPPRVDSPKFDSDAPQTRHQDLTFMTDAQVAHQLQVQMDRAEDLGYEFEYRTDEMLERSWELFETSMTEEYMGQHDWTKEKFIENWKRNIEAAGGDVNPRYVLAVLRDLNQGIEDGWMPVPTIPILIRRQNKDHDDSAQGQFQAKGRTGEGAFMWIFQDPLFQGDGPVNEGDNKPLMRWFVRDFTVSGLDEEVGVTPSHFPSEMAGAILHEMGHAWSDEHWGESMSLDAPEGRAFQIMESPTGRDEIADLISSYASERPKEAVAEAFALYHHPRYDQMDELRKDMVERILFGEEE